MSGADAGRVLLVAGLIAAAVGAFLVLGGRLPFGQLPGDISGSRGSFGYFIPLGSCLLLSVLLTVLLNVIIRR